MDAATAGRPGQGPAEILREIARELESELDTVQAQLSANETHARDIEARAMGAIERGDDLGAREQLIEMRTFSDEIGKLGADAHVLRSLIAEIREFLREHSPASEHGESGRSDA